MDIPAGQFAQLMAAITGTQLRLDNKLAEFKAEIVKNAQGYLCLRQPHKANANIDETLHEAEIELELEYAVSSDPAATSAVNRARDTF